MVLSTPSRAGLREWDGPSHTPNASTGCWAPHSPGLSQLQGSSMGGNTLVPVDLESAGASLALAASLREHT